MGRSSSFVRGNHVAIGPTVREVRMTHQGGHLPADVIQRVVRMNFGRFRQCYETGLRSDPSLRGRVVTKFVIARDGSVPLAQDAGSDLPNAQVNACVVRGFQSLSFPTPEGGQVHVTYPLVFTPGE
jgi:hypothetical protein